MSNYYEITIASDASLQELLIATLAEIGYEGFEESALLLKAYIREEMFEEDGLDKLLSSYNVKYSKSIIEKQNWNLLWESNFEPVQVDDFVGIRAGFHPPFNKVRHEIVITPKMSFGTGHHATTYLVMKLMAEVHFTGRTVLDFGTGTGILAILAEKLGAARVLAVDNDDWCIENARENILVNQCEHIDIQKNESLVIHTPYDCILANINRNIILENLPELVKGLGLNGQLLLSGLLETDEKEMTDACLAAGLTHHKTLIRNGWVAIWFVRNGAKGFIK